MRELKFRVWWKDKTLKPTIYTEGDLFDDTWTTVEYIAIEQYTGIKDKNGKEIYEGDIVNFMVERFDSITLGFDSEQWHTAVVEWNQDDACYSFVDGDEPFSVQFETEVIGNIHENGDLLND